MNRAAPNPPAKPGVDLLLMWHMHQPDYRDAATGDYTMPWVYLHAVKDYADMAWHLERNPGLRAVVNFVPVLLDQIEDYCDQFASGRLRDPLLRLLAREEATPLTEAERAHAFGQCFRADHHRLIAPFPPYQHLYQLFQAMEAQGANSLAYLSDRYLRDLVTWYHLSWTGETVRRESEVVARLMAQGTAFTREDRRALLQVYAEVVRQIIPRYRALAQRGQVELTSTPQCHPLAPLLIDFRCAHDALPETPLPQSDHYPGGLERVCAHLDAALASHARRFGAAPQGIWPAEGALSGSFAALLAQRGVRWTASGEGVLGNSLRLASAGAAAEAAAPASAAYHVHQPYRAPSVAPGLLFFFRDDRLSDLIGFVYSKWHGRDAAENFIHELEGIGAKFAGRPRPLVSVILDGENAWEYYPYNAFFFLSDLYRNLCQHDSIRTVTGSDIVAELAHADRTANALQRATVLETHQPDSAAAARPVGTLAALAAGSWVYGNLATWIGSPDKNHAWDLLCRAKVRYDEVIAAGLLDGAQQAQAQAQLADCEASDWFWWPGEDNPGESVTAFEALFRAKLGNLYRLLQSPPPAALSTAFSSGSGFGAARAEAGGTMRRGTA